MTEFKDKTKNEDCSGVFDITCAELKNQKDDVCMIDVRSEQEYVGELGHIKGTQLMVLDTLPSQLSQLPTDKAIVFVCRSGGRSARAAQFAQSQGFENVYNMKGGMLAWNEQNLPVERS